jgi:hypothetical protein
MDVNDDHFEDVEMKVEEEEVLKAFKEFEEFQLKKIR